MFSQTKPGSSRSKSVENQIWPLSPQYDSAKEAMPEKMSIKIVAITGISFFLMTPPPPPIQDQRRPQPNLRGHDQHGSLRLRVHANRWSIWSSKILSRRNISKLQGSKILTCDGQFKQILWWWYELRCFRILTVWNIGKWSRLCFYKNSLESHNCLKHLETNYSMFIIKLSREFCPMSRPFESK